MARRSLQLRRPRPNQRRLLPKPPLLRQVKVRRPPARDRRLRARDRRQRVQQRDRRQGALQRDRPRPVALILPRRVARIVPRLAAHIVPGPEDPRAAQLPGTEVEGVKRMEATLLTRRMAAPCGLDRTASEPMCTTPSAAWIFTTA